MLLRIRSLARDDRGSTMAAVIGLIMLIAVVSVTVMTSSVTAASYSTASRANVQSKASADAGIDVAFAKIYAGDYVCLVKSVVDPVYTATVVYKNSSGGLLACPVTSTTARVSGTPATAEITSIGDAAAKGTGIQTGNAEKVVAKASITQTTETIENTTTTPNPITASGPAIYSYSGGAFGGSGTLVSVGGSDPDIMIKNGDVTCSGGAQNGVSDFVVAGGALTLGGSCNISGNVWVGKRLSIEGGVTVKGNAVADGVTINSGTISGSVWAPTSDIIVNGNGTIGGNTTTTTLTMSSGTVNGNSWTYGHTALNWGTGIKGNLTTKTAYQPDYSGDLVQGTKTVTSPSTPGQSPYTTPSAPAAPNWSDYSYKSDDWAGFKAVTLSGSACGYTQLSQVLANNAGQPVVLLATGCTNGVVLTGAEKLTLSKDLAIIANKIDFGAGAALASTAAARVWLINQDSVNDKAATCNGQQILIGGGFTMASNLSMLMYSPCQLDIASGLSLYGQIYSGKVTLAGGATIYYKPIGLPGYNLGTGASIPTSTTTTSTTTGATTYSAALLSRLDVVS